MKFNIALFIALSVAGCSHSLPKNTTGEEPNRQVSSKVWQHWETVSKFRLKKFENVWAMSDIHGHLRKAQNLLFAGGLITDPETTDGEWVPNPDGQKQLVIIVGDYITKGGKNVKLVRYLNKLQNQASDDGSKIILLLGNNELEFLAGDVDNELLEEAEGGKNYDWLFKDKDVGPHVSVKELARKSKMAEIFRAMPVAAVLDEKWIFSHSGYFGGAAKKQDNLKVKTQKLNAYLEEVGDDLAKAKELARDGKYGDSEKIYLKQSGVNSFVARHNWWSDNLDENRELLRIKYRTLFFGHDPEAFFGHDDKDYGERGKIAATRDGAFVKLDTGMSDDEDRNGKMLKCPVSDPLPEIVVGNTTSCVQINRAGQESPLLLID